MRAKFIYEKFVEDSDPISDMNIGMIHQIKLWMKSINEPFEDKDQALIICAYKGKIDYVKYLLSAGADVHANNDWALQWASNKGHAKVVKVLLSAGANVHVFDDYALQLASRYGHIEVVKVLLNAGANVHVGNDNALQWASGNGHTEVVKVLKDWIVKENKVKESINEKFTEDSDPIKDMNIGLLHFWEKEHVRIGSISIGVLCRQYFNNCFNDTYLVDIVYGTLVNLVKGQTQQKAFDNASKYLFAHKNFNYKEIKILNNVLKTNFRINVKINKKRLKKSVNEKFTEDSDPIHDMGIGRTTNFEEIATKFMGKKRSSKSFHGLSPWLDYIRSLEGKTITGRFYYKKPDNKQFYLQKNPITFKICNYLSQHLGKTVIFYDELNNSYKVIKNARYVIR